MTENTERDDMTCLDTDKLLTTEAAARRLGLTQERLYRLAARGIVPRVVMGRLVRFSPRALDDFVASGGRTYDSETDPEPRDRSGTADDGV